MRLFLFTGLVLLSLGPLSAEAASYVLGAPAKVIPIGSPTTIGIFLDTEGEAVNAVGGMVSLPASSTDIKVNDGASFVALWVVPPTVSGQTVTFEGIIPGGVNGPQIPLFTVDFTATAPGNVSVHTDKEQVFRHDGLGTELFTASAILSLSASADAPPFATGAPDLEPPEFFTPSIVKSPHLADGQAVVIFATADKQSGMAYYEVRETNGLSDTGWIKASSPYVLVDQSKFNKVSVRAVDHAGNERSVVAARLPSLTVLIVVSCILLVAAGSLLFWYISRRKLWRKSKVKRK